MWIGILFVALLVGFLVVRWLRSRTLGSSEYGDAGFGLSDLRKLRQEGRITEEEFEKARDAIVGAMKRSMEREEEAASDKSPQRDLKR